ncbi:hypothetical protein, partial [Hydrogenimonas sp.]
TGDPLYRGIAITAIFLSALAGYGIVAIKNPTGRLVGMFALMATMGGLLWMHPIKESTPHCPNPTVKDANATR